MSTRCQIVVQGSPVFIYKHSDGYPEGVLPTLVPFLKQFKAERGFDAPYMVAQIVRAFALAEDKELADYRRKERKGELSKGFAKRMEVSHRSLGWGLDCEIHGDLDYIYQIRKDWTLEVLGRIPGAFESCTLKRSKVVESIEI